MKLAIVGSQLLDGNPQAWYLIRQAFDRYAPTVFVSGGAKGIDTMAEQEARARGITLEIYRPALHQWKGEGGFQERNLQIATACDVLIRIIATTTKTYGSGWARDRAKEQGKPTEEFVIPP